MQIPRFRCKMTLHLIPEPEEKASELLRDLIANDNGVTGRSVATLESKAAGCDNSMN
jgi:hypothetical protein